MCIIKLRPSSSAAAKYDQDESSVPPRALTNTIKPPPSAPVFTAVSRGKGTEQEGQETDGRGLKEKEGHIGGGGGGEDIDGEGQQEGQEQGQNHSLSQENSVIIIPPSSSSPATNSLPPPGSSLPTTHQQQPQRQQQRTPSQQSIAQRPGPRPGLGDSARRSESSIGMWKGPRGSGTSFRTTRERIVVVDGEGRRREYYRRDESGL